MERINVSSGSPFEESNGFSRAVKIGGIISVSGTAPIAIDGSTACKNDLYGQTKCCFEIIQKAIEDAGGKLENVIRTRVMLTDIDNWKEAAKAHGGFFNKIKSACTFVEVSRFVDAEWLVECEADCVVET